MYNIQYSGVYRNKFLRELKKMYDNIITIKINVHTNHTFQGGGIEHLNP